MDRAIAVKALKHNETKECEINRFSELFFNISYAARLLIFKLCDQRDMTSFKGLGSSNMGTQLGFVIRHANILRSCEPALNSSAFVVPADLSLISKAPNTAWSFVY